MNDHDNPAKADETPPGRGHYYLDPVQQGRYLLKEWGNMFRPSTLPADIMAGVAVALVALPLSLAIANASGVDPKVGLVTAIVGGIVVALFGGCRLQVSGPAAAMTFLVYEIVVNFGIGGLIAVTMLAGLMQVASGVFRIGRFMQFMPRPVVAGFLSGIGITIFSTQLSKVMGYDVSHSEEGGAVGVLYETFQKLDQAQWTSLAVGLTAVVLMFLVPRISRRLPTPLIAVATATALPWMMGWTQVNLLGELPRGFPTPTFPTIPWSQWNEIVMAAFAVYFLASIESLLSAAVVDSMSRETRTDHDQELVGQGLGNIASSLFGGIPVTGVIARSATNIQAGARTRFSAIFHAGLILAMMVALGPLVARIPIAALAGVLLAVAIRMIEFRMLKTLWHGSRIEAGVYLVTVGTICVTDLIVGVPVGLVAAFVYVVYELSRPQLQDVHITQHLLGEEALAEGNGIIEQCPVVRVLRVDGPLFFASGFHLSNVVSKMRWYRSVILDLHEVPMLDFTAAEIMEESIEALKGRGIEVILARPPGVVKQRLKGLTLTELHALRECPIFDDLGAAIRHAESLLTEDQLCDQCKGKGRCQELARAIEHLETTGNTIETVQDRETKIET